ncbi:hypothetical protein CJ030_MR1G001447 [Morella rubra]|uniref:Protein kinase domain-containing protein n=1 Tax=Morella rubra TaxID=262757 RepID=A0A6A1WMT3_9ROSI|nr:hypothetical protein CJ030_MR1G001447 [Morella rubra]
MMPRIAIKSCLLRSSISLKFEERLLTRLDGLSRRCSVFRKLSQHQEWQRVLQSASGIRAHGSLWDLIQNGPALCERDVQHIGPLEGSFRGNPNYMSPESVARGQIEPALDVWSLGCIVVEMLSGKRA